MLSTSGNRGYKVRIKNNQTGEIRESDQDLDWGEGSLFWWTDGNFGCDCNREWVFQRAGNEPISDDPECGNSRYTVIDAVLDSGVVIKIDP
jgi:hypothetical protein